MPLAEALKLSSVDITAIDAGSGQTYRWGYVPAVVAKIGVFLKENALRVEGVFRIAGSQKRMKELQAIFETPPKYGRYLTWETTNFRVHDAASVFRRYLNHLPEPIIPLDLYHEFRNVLAVRPFDEHAAERSYKILIPRFPPANRYLLLYVLDLLALFADNSDKNRMTAASASTHSFLPHRASLHDPDLLTLGQISP